MLNRRSLLQALASLPLVSVGCAEVHGQGAPIRVGVLHALSGSLAATARLHGADERRYLAWLLRELARREWSPEAAARLLPEAWLAAQEKKAEEGASVEV